MSTTKTVKNVSDTELSIPGVGSVASGQTAEVPADFHNANFEEVKTPKKDERKTETA